MIFEQPQELRQRITELTKREIRRTVKVFEDTSAFTSIDAGCVLRIAGNDYLVLGHGREGRFGLDDQPKFWVKTAIDLSTGERKIIKLVFHEEFNSRVGTAVFRCVRSAKKESAILQAMRGHPSFMQGESACDAAGNLVRIIDSVPGPSLYEHLRRLDMTHEAYYRQALPESIQPLIECIYAISELHRKGMHHGDIRADHILLDNRTGTYVWIDFDYEISHPYYDVLCLGNVVLQAVGKGRHSLYDIRDRPSEYPDLCDELVSGDMSLMYPHRVANLRKLFPYISAPVNEMLMRYSTGSADPYREVDHLLEDLRALFPTHGSPTTISPP